MNFQPMIDFMDRLTSCASREMLLRSVLIIRKYFRMLLAIRILKRRLK